MLAPCPALGSMKGLPAAAQSRAPSSAASSTSCDDIVEVQAEEPPVARPRQGPAQRRCGAPPLRKRPRTHATPAGPESKAATPDVRLELNEETIRVDSSVAADGVRCAIPSAVCPSGAVGLPIVAGGRWDERWTTEKLGAVLSRCLQVPTTSVSCWAKP